MTTPNRAARGGTRHQARWSALTIGMARAMARAMARRAGRRRAPSRSGAIGATRALAGRAGRLGRRAAGRRGPARPAALAAAGAATGAGAVAIAAVARRRARGRATAALDAVAPERVNGHRVREVDYAITIGKPVGEVFAFWRELGNLAQVMAHLERVEAIDERRSRWVARGPGGQTVSWEAELQAEEPGRLLAWRTLQPVAVPHVGRVEFRPAPGARGTEVRVRASYLPPGGRAGVALAWLAGREPRQQVREDLRRLKRVLECGEVIRVDEQPSGRGKGMRRVAGTVDRLLRKGGRP